MSHQLGLSDVLPLLGSVNLTNPATAITGLMPMLSHLDLNQLNLTDILPSVVPLLGSVNMSSVNLTQVLLGVVPVLARSNLTKANENAVLGAIAQIMPTVDVNAVNWPAVLPAFTPWLRRLDTRGLSNATPFFQNFSKILAKIKDVGRFNMLYAITPLVARESNYTGAHPYQGTGIRQIIYWADRHGLVNDANLDLLIPRLPAVFGGYARNRSSETGPDGLMLALFILLMFGALFIWIMNLWRSHHFHLSLGLAFFCAMKVIGYSCRIAWAKKIQLVASAVTSVVFIQVAQLVLMALNQVLAHRIFTWRHPETGNSWWINFYFNFVYFWVLVIIALAIMGEAIPFVHFLDHHHQTMCTNVKKAAAVFNVVYGTVPYQTLFFAFLFSPGQIAEEPWRKLDRNRELPPVYQATWIKSANTFYYVPRSFRRIIYRNEPAAKAIRIMPSREPPAKGRHRPHHTGEVMHPKSPRILVALWIVITSSFLLLFGTTLRVASIFRGGEMGQPIHFWPNHPYVMVVWYGALEVVVILIFLVLRIDLRFFLPDCARRNRPGGPIEDEEEKKAVEEEGRLPTPPPATEEDVRVMSLPSQVASLLSRQNSTKSVEQVDP